jgi:RND superfamily putative drug exporter
MPSAECRWLALRPSPVRRDELEHFSSVQRMFETFGKLVSRTWPLLLVFWLAALAGLKWAAPPWKDVAADGEFAFLPKDSPSRVAEELFRQAWGEPLASNVVIIVRRERPTGLLESDKSFINDVLRKRLEAIADEETPSLQPQVLNPLESKSAPSDPGAAPEADLKSITIRTLSDKSVGRLLNSEDKQASLVLIELPTEFLDARNQSLIAKVERLIGYVDRNGVRHPGELQAEDLPATERVPPGLDLALSGSATVGRDMIRAAEESSRDTELWTFLLVLLLLGLIYRAPLMAFIPLMTVAVATEISLALLACLAKAGILHLFAGIEVYVKVLSYGAGVDYCLFLIARYKEELDEGATLDQAVASSLSKVGHALVASAGTVICGIFMMYFAQFGKFSQAGIAITVGLVIVLAAALTFAPAIMRLVRQWAFWPRVAQTRLTNTAGWVSATSFWSRFFERPWGQLAWTHVSGLVHRRPGSVLLASILLMLPFAWVGVQFRGHLSYGLLSELPRDTASVVGADAVAQHYPKGIAGPITVLIQSDRGSFLNEDDEQLSEDANQLIQTLTGQLRDQQERLQLADVRTVLHPFGGGLSTLQDDAAKQRNDNGIQLASGSSPLVRAMGDRLTKKRTQQHYVSSHGDLAGKVLRVDLVLQEDPFARNSIAQFESIRGSIAGTVPAGLKVFTLGPTASIRDLKIVTDSDQIRINSLVLGGVFLILIVLLTHPTVSKLFAGRAPDTRVVTLRQELASRFSITVYLIVSVFFSYLVTLGVTFVVFWGMDPAGFGGLDWKVPMFLFTILIAVGEDYNIFLMTRIDEEQHLHGRTEGVISALQKTGSIISSCGIIMAGTFCSLLAGSLVGLHQLGFALAFGVLLDTFVVRPILVPAFLVLLHEGRLTSLSRLLTRPAAVSQSATAEAGRSFEVGGE